MRPALRLDLACAEREHKKLEKKVKQKQEVGKEQVKAALTRALALVNAEKGECACQSAPGWSALSRRRRFFELTTVCLRSSRDGRGQGAVLHGAGRPRRAARRSL